MENSSGLLTSPNCTLDDSFGFLCNKDSLQMTFILLKSLALGIIILLTICGNVLVLMAVALSPNLRSSTHYLIVNLAVADLLLGTTVLPFSAVFEITGRLVQTTNYQTMYKVYKIHKKYTVKNVTWIFSCLFDGSLVQNETTYDGNPIVLLENWSSMIRTCSKFTSCFSMENK